MIDMNQRPSKRSNVSCAKVEYWCSFYCATANNGYREQFELAKRWAVQDMFIELSKLSHNLMAATRKGRGGHQGEGGGDMQEKPAWKQ